jgi:cell division septation protein DedD
VDALSNLFGRTQISLLQSTFTINEEKHAVELLGIPVVKTTAMLEEDFLIAIQNYIISHPRPPSLTSTALQNVSHSAPHASAVAVQPHAVAAQPSSLPAHSVPVQVSSFTPSSSASTAPAFAGQGIGRKDKVSRNKCKHCDILPH